MLVITLPCIVAMDVRVKSEEIMKYFDDISIVPTKHKTTGLIQVYLPEFRDTHFARKWLTDSFANVRYIPY